MRGAIHLIEPGGQGRPGEGKGEHDRLLEVAVDEYHERGATLRAGRDRHPGIGQLWLRPVAVLEVPEDGVEQLRPTGSRDVSAGEHLGPVGDHPAGPPEGKQVHLRTPHPHVGGRHDDRLVTLELPHLGLADQ